MTVLFYPKVSLLELMKFCSSLIRVLLLICRQHNTTHFNYTLAKNLRVYHIMLVYELQVIYVIQEHTHTLTNSLY